MLCTDPPQYYHYDRHGNRTYRTYGVDYRTKEEKALAAKSPSRIVQGRDIDALDDRLRIVEAEVSVLRIMVKDLINHVNLKPDVCNLREVPQ